MASTAGSAEKSSACAGVGPPLRTSTLTGVSAASGVPSSVAVTLTDRWPRCSSTDSGERVSTMPVDAWSLSVTLTVTSCSASPAMPEIVCDIAASSVSESSSSAARTVTVCGAAQFAVVKVSLPGAVVTSLSPVTSSVTVTVPDGCESSTIV